MHYIETLQKGETVPSSFWAIYKKSSERLIRDCNVVVCTTVNSFKLYEYTEFRPGVGVVDEAAQASWADSYGFLAFGVRRMVFVGDEKQLAPTVIGDSTANNILKETMFEKLCQKNQKYFVHLVRQYRMHPKIS
jgi:superfamily I DNA and/or RNA helicase